ncbi:MAG: hypothetical protein ACJ8H8_25465 [Geminicoccaceae bacterium]
MKPSNWGVELRLTRNSFDLLKALVAGGYFLGDYMGLVTRAKKVLPVFVLTDGNDRTNIFTRPIDFGASAGLLAAAP